MPKENEPSHSWGIAGLVLGILGLLLFLAPYVGIVFSITAVVFYGLQQRHGSTGPASGALVTGIIGIILNGIMLIFFIGVLAFFGAVSSETGTIRGDVSDTQAEINVVSNSFSDFDVLCDIDSTSLQKRDLFDTKFRNNYVEWTGVVSSISDSFGSYRLQVKHCPRTFVSDIVVTMKEDQKDNLLKYSEGDTITYRAKLTRMGDILGLSASDGIIVS